MKGGIEANSARSRGRGSGIASSCTDAPGTRVHITMHAIAEMHRFVDRMRDQHRRDRAGRPDALAFRCSAAAA